MPYSGPRDSKLPSYIKEKPEKKRAQWVAVWNSSYAKAKKEGKSEKEAEKVAFRNANGVVMKLDNLTDEQVRETLEKMLTVIFNINVSPEEEGEPEPYLPEDNYMVNSPLTKDTLPVKKLDAQYKIVYGVVLEPGTIDAQDDVISEEEIFKSMHDYMLNAQKINLQHTPFDVDSAIIENFIAPVDMEIAGETVKKGSWVMGVKILDEKVWKAVEEGKFNAYSIEGRGVRTSKEEN